MSVYVELVIFNNFFVDLMLLYATVSLRRRKFSAGRGILAALIGAVCATAYAVLPYWTRIVMRILLAPVMCAICTTASGKDFKHKAGYFIGTVFIFVLLTYFTGGIVYGISFALGVDIKSYAVLGLMAIAVIALILCAKLIAHKRSCASQATCKTTIQVGERVVNVDALCDSGNLLVDDISGLPIVILSKDIEDKLDMHKYNGFVQVSTVGGDDSLLLVDIDEICVNGHKFKALGALSHKSFDSFDIILQNSMF